MHRESGDDLEEEGGGKGGPGGGPGGGRGKQGGGCACECGPGCACSGQEQGKPDHLDETAGHYERAFFEALQELRTEAVKARIKTAFGKNIDATAKEVVDAMLKEWEDFQEREAERAAEDLKKKGPNARQALRDILKKGMKKGPQ